MLGFTLFNLIYELLNMLKLDFFPIIKFIYLIICQVNKLVRNIIILGIK